MNERAHERPTWRGFRIGVATALMVLSAVSFLKYAWWAACYSGWYGLPNYAQQLRLAAAHASLLSLERDRAAGRDFGRRVGSDETALYRSVTISPIRCTSGSIGSDNDCWNRFIWLAPKLGPLLSYSMTA